MLKTIKFPIQWYVTTLYRSESTAGAAKKARTDFSTAILAPTVVSLEVHRCHTIGAVGSYKLLSPNFLSPLPFFIQKKEMRISTFFLQILLPWKSQFLMCITVKYICFHGNPAWRIPRTVRTTTLSCWSSGSSEKEQHPDPRIKRGPVLWIRKYKIGTSTEASPGFDVG